MGCGFRAGWLAMALLTSSSVVAQPSVKISVAKKQDLERQVVYAGRLEPVRRVTQQALFQGKVIKQLLKPGAEVKRGEAVMTLERLSLGQDFSSFTVRSHITGRINDVFVDPGMEFNTGANLFEVVDLSRLMARIGVSDKDIATIKQGGLALAYGPDGKTVEGNITSVALTVASATGLYPVEASFPADQGLLPGQFVKLRVGTRAFSGVAIEREAVVQKFGKPHLFVMKKDKVELRELTLGPDFGSQVGVTGGLNEGESYVLEASEDLQDGVVVQLREDKPAGGPGGRG